MWPPFTWKSASPEDHEARLSAVEGLVTQHAAWIREHEDYARGKLLGVEGDISMIAAAVNDLRSEIESERKERFATVMEAFAQAAEGIITRVLSSTRNELGIARADMQDLKARVNVLELRGEDAE